MWPFNRKKKEKSEVKRKPGMPYEPDNSWIHSNTNNIRNNTVVESGGYNYDSGGSSYDSGSSCDSSSSSSSDSGGSCGGGD